MKFVMLSVVWLSVLVNAAMLLCPPWRLKWSDGEGFVGYAPIWQPPEDFSPDYASPHIGLLVLQSVAVLLFAAAALITIKVTKKRPEVSKEH